MGLRSLAEQYRIDSTQFGAFIEELKSRSQSRERVTWGEAMKT